MSEGALDLLWTLRLETNERWGDVAVPHQVDDAIAILSEDRPNQHFITRPRGASKTTDIAAIALSWLAEAAPAYSTGRVIASSTDQASYVIDAAHAFRSRTPQLAGIEVETKRIIAPNKATVEVLAQSDSGAWGVLNARLLVLDEFCQWPSTRAARRVYTAVRSTVQKVPGCKLVILSSAGEPSHWSFTDVYLKALDSPETWRVSEMPGPVPWQDEKDLTALRLELRPSEYERLVLNQWAEDEDRAISPDDYLAAAQQGTVTVEGRVTTSRLHYPRAGVKYVCTVDIGIFVDATVVCIAHREPAVQEDPNGPQRVVVDLLKRWQGSKKSPVQLTQIEDFLAAETPSWNHAHVHADPDQFQGSLQRLQRRGIRADPWAFTSTSVGRVATALVTAFRTGQIHVPHSRELQEELVRLRLRDNVHGVTRLDHERGGHDDQAVCIGMATHILLGRMWGQGHAFLHAMKADIEKRETEPVAPIVRPLAFFADPTPLDASSCRDPRYFGIERRCAYCGNGPETHAKRVS